MAPDTAAKCWRVIAHSGNAAQALGQRSHIIQVEAIGQFKSKAAFARALVAAGLFATERSALTQMNHDGGETWNERSRVVAGMMPETVLVGPLNSTSSDVYIVWPPQKTPQVPVPPMMSQLAESDRIVRAAEESLAEPEDEVQFCSFCSEPFPIADPMVDYDGQTFCSPNCVRDLLANDDPCDHQQYVAAVGRFNDLLGRVLAADEESSG